MRFRTIVRTPKLRAEIEDFKGRWTEIGEQSSGETAAADIEAEWAANRSTIAATWTSRNAGALGVEIKARAVAP